VLRDYDWDTIAEKTMKVYDLALKAAPRHDTIHSRFPFLMSKEFPEELRILLVMHILGIVEEENAKRPAELAELLGMSVARLHGLLQKLLVSGYVTCYRDDLRRLRYFLTKLGIVKVCSAFS
jgi:DNA-binding MarR family transcriptional regulator